jgi:hypothetical protein
MVAGDHDDSNATTRAGFHSGGHLRADRVGKADKAQKAEVEVVLTVRPCLGGALST